MALPIKVRNLLDKFLGNQDPQPIELHEYPDTGETGETYELEFDARPDAIDAEAMKNAQEFLKEQREQSLPAQR